MINERLTARMNRSEKFHDWSEAYDYCREANYPVDVCVTDDNGTEYAKIFPGGSCKTFLVIRDNPISDDRNFRESPCDTLRD